jgi:hypothetical protein
MVEVVADHPMLGYIVTGCGSAAANARATILAAFYGRWIHS